MIKELNRSGLALAGLAALLLAGACSSTTSSSNDTLAVNKQNEVRPFTERGYDPTHSAPEIEDANNDGIADTSASTPRSNALPSGPTVVATEASGGGSVTVTHEPMATETYAEQTTESTPAPMTSSTTQSSETSASTTEPITAESSAAESSAAESTSSSGTTTPMTSSAQSNTNETPAPTRQRLRKD